MLSKRKNNGCFGRVWCTEHQNAPDPSCAECCEKDENLAPTKPDQIGDQEPEANVGKKVTRAGNGPNKARAGNQNNRKYKGRNRR